MNVWDRTVPASKYCKICNKLRMAGDHSACGESMDRARISAKANLFVPMELDDDYDDMRDIELNIPKDDE